MFIFNIQIKITRTTQTTQGNYTLCALRRIEVWGQVAATYRNRHRQSTSTSRGNADIVTDLHGARQTNLNEPRGYVGNFYRSLVEIPPTVVATTSGAASLHVARPTSAPRLDPVTAAESPASTTPNDFLDQLTWTIMSVPMLLPSGHNIDLSSVEKITKQAQISGRSPFDPFTGIAYTRFLYNFINDM